VGPMVVDPHVINNIYKYNAGIKNENKLRINI